MPALDTSMPKWFVDAVEWQTEGKAAEQSLRMEEGRQQMASNFLDMQQKQANIDLTKMKTAQMSKGTDDVAMWMHESQGDPNWMVNHPYTGTNPYAAEQISNAQIRASQSITVTKAKEDLTQFNSRLAKLPPDSRAAIHGMQDDPRTGLPSAMKWSALSLAEESEARRIQNEKEIAESEAAQRGDVETTQVGPRGVTSTYKPAPAGAASQMGEPTIKELPDGSKLVHVSPNRWQYVKGEKTKEWSDSQLGAYSKVLKEVDPNDPTAKEIDAHLKSDVQKQLNKASPTTSKPTGAIPEQYDIDYLKAHPELKDKFESRFGAGSAANYLGQ